jgi:hypothetical protein
MTHAGANVKTERSLCSAALGCCNRRPVRSLLQLQVCDDLLALPRGVATVTEDLGDASRPTATASIGEKEAGALATPVLRSWSSWSRPPNSTSRVSSQAPTRRSSSRRERSARVPSPVGTTRDRGGCVSCRVDDAGRGSTGALRFPRCVRVRRQSNFPARRLSGSSVGVRSTERFSRHGKGHYFSPEERTARSQCRPNKLPPWQ